MKKIFLLLLFLALSFPGFTQDSLNVSLESISQLALANSPDIQIAKFDASIARYSRDKVESIFDAYFNAQAASSDNQTEPVSALYGDRIDTDIYSFGLTKKMPSGTQLTFSASDTKIDSNSLASAINPQTQAEARFTLTQALGKNFFGLIDRNNITITKLDIENAQHTCLDNIEQTLYSAQIAYLKFLLADQELALKEEMLKKAQWLYKIYQDKLVSGLAEQGDFYAIEANLRSRENDQLNAKLQKETAKNDLLFLLNQDDSSINLIPQDNLAIDSIDIDLTDTLKQAIANRRDYKKVKNNLKMLGLEVITKKNALWPQIDLNASLRYNGINGQRSQAWDEVKGDNQREFFTGINVSVPLENHYAKADLKQSKLAKEKILLLLKKIERLIFTQINNRVNEANSLRNQTQLYQKIVDLQKNKLDYEYNRLKTGRSNADLIIRYENDLLAAQLAKSYALFQYRVSLLTLELTKNSLLDKYWKEGAL